MGAYESGVMAPYTLADVREAPRILAGLDPATIAELFRLSVIPAPFAPDRLDMSDIVTLARKAAGLMPNP